jgi:hypothetical protein
MSMIQVALLKQAVGSVDEIIGRINTFLPGDLIECERRSATAQSGKYTLVVSVTSVSREGGLLVLRVYDGKTTEIRIETSYGGEGPCFVYRGQPVLSLTLRQRGNMKFADSDDYMPGIMPPSAFRGGQIAFA